MTFAPRSRSGERGEGRFYLRDFFLCEDDVLVDFFFATFFFAVAFLTAACFTSV